MSKFILGFLLIVAATFALSGCKEATATEITYHERRIIGYDIHHRDFVVKLKYNAKKKVWYIEHYGRIEHLKTPPSEPEQAKD